MKKKLFVSLLLCLVLLLSFSCLAFADSRAHVGDSAGLLSAAEYTELENMCAAVSDKYGCGVYIITVSDFRQYGNSVESAAEAIFKGTGMGVGEEEGVGVPAISGSTEIQPAAQKKQQRTMTARTVEPPAFFMRLPP